ncbi:MAG TPA: hypothetical protein VMY05_01890 [Acidobacteriota bacterium]|nr:hypothetical protein [Acidobacteriota bacterium]
MFVHSAYSELSLEVIHDLSICTRKMPLCGYASTSDVVLILDFRRDPYM